MGTRYSVTKTATALSTSLDSLVMIAPSTRAIKIWRIAIYGGGTASAANEIVLARLSANGTNSGAITPTPLSSGGSAAASTVNGTQTVASTQGAILDRFAVNSNGGVDVHAYPFGQELEIPPSGAVGLRAVSGTSPVTIEVIFEEVG